MTIGSQAESGRSRGMQNSMRAVAARIPGLMILGLLLACLAAYAPRVRAVVPSGVRHFDIAAQPLATALVEFARQSDRQILFSTPVVESKRTDGIKGEFEPEVALRQLLKGSGLVFRVSGDDTISVDVPRPSEGVQAAGPGPRVAQGLSVPEPDRNKSESGEDRSSPERNSDEPAQELEEVVVTAGSRLRRSNEGPSPVVVISREDIERSGAAETREVMNRITQNAVSPDESGNASFLGASTVQLRGLPVGTTLLLLNGRRLGSSGANAAANFFDLNNIPLAAIERIEVLTDSASAIYGADAIGGAVNIVLKKDFTGVGANVRYGESSKGDAAERNASLALGGRSGAFSGLMVLDYFKRDPLRGTDRDLTSSDDFRRFGGQDLRSASSYPGNVYSLNFDPATGAPLPLPGLTSPFAGIPSGNGIGLTPADFAATDGVLNLFDGASYKTLQAAANRKSLFASGRYDLSNGVTFFSEVLYTNREQIVQLAPDVLFLGQFGLFTVPATNPFNPFGVPVGIDYRFTELGPRSNDATTNFVRFLVGAEGTLGERFDWQAYVLSDRDSSAIFNRNTINAFLHATVQQFLDSTDPNVALNVFSTTGNNNPDTLAAIIASGQTTDETATHAYMAEAVVRGPLLDLPAGPVNAALGVNYRREKLDFQVTGILDVFDDRDVRAAFAEVSVPLVGSAQQVPGVYSLELTAALRHDRYQDDQAPQLKSSTNPQFGLAWRPMQGLTVRGTYGTAFKEPTAFDLLLPRSSFVAFALDPARNNTLSTFSETFGGNKELAPERGQSVTAGLVWTPAFMPGASATVNFFRVKQEDFITALDVDTMLANEALFPGRVVRGPPLPGDPPGTPGPITSVDVSNINFGRLTVRGADLELQYAFPGTAYGQFVSTLAGTYVDSYEILVKPGTQPLNLVNHANSAGYPLRFKGNAALSWAGSGGWSATATLRYLNSYLDYDGLRRLPSQTLLDLQLGYRFGDEKAQGFLQGLRATFGIINLTDHQGDFSNSFAGYDPLQADLRGRFYYLNLQTNF